MRNLRIRQLLLLILRTAIILLIVLAFARPTLDSGQAGLLSERSEVEAVIVLDNSLSMNEVKLTGSLLEQLRQSFISLESAFQPGDRISILQSTSSPEWLVQDESFQPGLWERVLQRLQTNYLKSDLTNAIDMATRKLQRSRLSGREIYILSDFQASALAPADIEPLLNEPSSEGIRYFAMRIAHTAVDNISVDSVEVKNRLVEVNQPLQLQVFLTNQHSDKHLATLTSVLLNGNRVAQKNVNLAPGQLTEVPFNITLTDNGFIKGEIEIESDALQEDNRRYFNIYVPERIRSLHIVPDKAFQSFLPLIVQPATERGVFEFEQDVLLNWTSHNFSKYDVIVLEGLNQIPETLMQRLDQFVAQGGGALIIPGENIAAGSYQKVLRRTQIGEFVERVGTPGNSDQFLTVQNVLWNHAIFEGLFEDKKKQVSPIEVFAAYKLRTAGSAVTLVGLSDRSPLLIQSNQQKGTVLFLTTPLNPRWTQLPFKGFVVPLMYRAIYYAGNRKIQDRQSMRTGQALTQEFSNLEAPYDFVIRGDEVEAKLTPRIKGSTLFLEYRNAPLPANMEILQNDELIGLLSVNTWPEESRADFLSPEELTKAVSGITLLSVDGIVGEQVQNSRFGQEFWKQLLILALVLLLVEMLVARTGYKNEQALAT